MRLYSCQPRFVYDALCSDGRFLPRPLLAGDKWQFADLPSEQFAYEWLCREMQERGLARPEPDTYPVWAWQQYESSVRPKPDLRRLRHNTPDEREVMFTLEVPDEEVLLHDYDAWHHPLNHFYLGTEKANADFERRCKAAGCPLYDAKPLAHPELLKELESSWRLMFDLAGLRRLTRKPASSQSVQATFWELRADQVIIAVEYGAGRQRQRLARPDRHKPSISLQNSRSSA